MALFQVTGKHVEQVEHLERNAVSRAAAEALRRPSRRVHWVVRWVPLVVAAAAAGGGAAGGGAAGAARRTGW